MSVVVSLEQLVLIADTKPVWPEEFAGIVAKLEESASERTQWGVLADWLQENKEPGMETACRYVVKRPEIVISKRNASHTNSKLGYVWGFEGLPNSVGGCISYVGNVSSLAGAIASLSRALEKHRSEGA